MTTQTPLTDERIQELAKEAAQWYFAHAGAGRSLSGCIERIIRQSITEALTAEREKNAKLREEACQDEAEAVKGLVEALEKISTFPRKGFPGDIAADALKAWKGE